MKGLLKPKLEERTAEFDPRGRSTMVICPIFNGIDFGIVGGPDRYGFDQFSNTIWVIDMTVIKNWDPSSNPNTVRAMIEIEGWTGSQEKFLTTHVAKIQLPSTGLITNPDPATKDIAVLLNDGAVRSYDSMGFIVEKLAVTQEARERLISSVQVKEVESKDRFLDRSFKGFLA